MNKQEYINTAEKELLHTYNRFSLVLDHGEVFIFMIRTGRNIWILQRASPYVHSDMETRNTTMH